MDETQDQSNARAGEAAGAAAGEKALPTAERAAVPALVASAGELPLGSLVDVPLRITVELGSSKMLVREVLQLNRGSVVALDRSSGDPADILVNGRLIARGEVTVVDDRLAIRVVELVGRDSKNGSS